MEPAGPGSSHPRLGCETARAQTDEFGASLYHEGDGTVVDSVAAVVERRGIPRAQVALAWLAAKPVVTSPIVGVTSSTT